MIDYDVNMFGSKPKLNFMLPLEKVDYPELDTSECLCQDVMKKYQSLIGDIQWVISLGRLDVNVVVMTLDSFRSEPR